MSTAKLIAEVAQGRPVRVENVKAEPAPPPPALPDPVLGLSGLIAWIDGTVKGLSEAIATLAEENAKLRAEVRELSEKRFTRLLERDGKIIGTERVATRDEVLK